MFDVLYYCEIILETHYKPAELSEECSMNVTWQRLQFLLTNSSVSEYHMTQWCQHGSAYPRVRVEDSAVVSGDGISDMRQERGAMHQCPGLQTYLDNDDQRKHHQNKIVIDNNP